ESVFAELRAAIPSPDGDAARILEVLETTASINRDFVTGRNYESNLKRSSNLKANFLRYYRAAQEQGEAMPRAVLKFGAFPRGARVERRAPVRRRLAGRCTRGNERQPLLPRARDGRAGHAARAVRRHVARLPAAAGRDDRGGVDAGAAGGAAGVRLHRLRPAADPRPHPGPQTAQRPGSTGASDLRLRRRSEEHGLAAGARGGGTALTSGVCLRVFRSAHEPRSRAARRVRGSCDSRHYTSRADPGWSCLRSRYRARHNRRVVSAGTVGRTPPRPGVMIAP